MLAHWVETGSWWQSADARAVIGSDDTGDAPVETRWRRSGGRDLLGERELWRVEAAAGMAPVDAEAGDDTAAGCSTCPSTGPTVPGSSSAAWTEVIAA